MQLTKRDAEALKRDIRRGASDIATDLLRTLVEGGAPLNWAQMRLIAIADTAQYDGIDAAYATVKREIERGKIPGARVD